MQRRKFFLTILGLVICTFSLTAQTTLPTSWDCNPATLPSVGWTTNVSDYYNTGSTGYYCIPPSAKLNLDHKYVKINVSDPPGIIQYCLRGSVFSGLTAEFSLEESVDGVVWTDIRVFNNSNPPPDYMVTYTDTANPTSRWIRFYYDEKESGNIALDEIYINPAPQGPEQEIGIKVDLNAIASGNEYIVGNDPSTTFKIINYGTDSILDITNVTFSGTDASMFSVPDLPDSVPANDSVTFTLVFTPSGLDGTKTATMQIGNNDDNENPYIIDLWAVKGSYATEPVDNAINMTFTYMKSYSFRVNFSNGATVPDGFLVLRKTGASITEAPVDGQTYILGEYIGDAQVAHVGDDGYFYPSNIIANTEYYFKIFPFNGYPGYENYLDSSPLSGDTTTLPDMIEDYYNNIYPDSCTFLQDLHDLINPHTIKDYSMYDDYIIDDFQYRDTVIAGVSKKAINCAYSDEKYIYSDPWSWTFYSREHCFCKSWMPTFPLTTTPEYSDYHNLFPVNQSFVNSYRSNNPMGEVDSISFQYYNGMLGYDTLNHLIYEPSDNIKGNVARAMFYVLVCYDGVDGNEWRLPDTLSVFYPYGQDVNVLYAWHVLDSVDNWEMSRNDFIGNVQGNRNPFIDHPEWVDLIDFDNMKLWTGGCSSYEELKKTEIKTDIFPNPASGNFFIRMTGLNEKVEGVVKITDLTGRLIYSQSFLMRPGRNVTEIDNVLQSGIYIVNVESDKGVRYSEKLIIY